MGLVKVVIDRHGGTTKLLEKPTGRKEANIIKAKIDLNGTRAVDTAEITLDAKIPVARGDVIKYIQDIVPTEGLRGFYNFQHNPRDESGNDADENGTQVGDYGNANRSGWSRNIDKYLSCRNASNDWVDIKSEKMIEDATEEVINLSGKFDMFLWFRVLGTPLAGELFLGKRASGGTGFAFRRDASDQLDFLKYDGVGGLTVITGDTVVSGTEWHLARVKRDGDDLITLYIDGVFDASATDAQDFTTTTNLQFGNTGLGDNPANNMDIGQFRIYSGVNLSDSDANKILTYKRQHSIMKFAGTIYKIDDKTSHKVVHAKAWSRIITELEASPDTLDARDESANNNGIDNVFLDDATNRMTHFQIIEQTMATLDSDNTYRKWISSPYDTGAPTTPVISAYAMSGNFLRVFQLLIQRAALDEFFLTTPRKVVLVGDLDNINETPDTTKGYHFINGQNCKMTKTGKDDTKIINDVTILSENITQRRIEDDSEATHINGGADQWKDGSNIYNASLSYPVLFPPTGAVQVNVNGTLLKQQVHEDAAVPVGGFKLDTLNRAIILQAAPATAGTLEIRYEYEDTTSENVMASSTASIMEYGRRLRRIFVGGMKDLSFLSNLASNIISIFADANERVTAELPYLANELQIFQECALTNSVKDGTGGNPSIGNGNYRIASMSFLYPEARTIVNFGEHIFDAYDYDITLSEKHRENAMIITKTKHIKS